MGDTRSGQIPKQSETPIKAETPSMGIGSMFNIAFGDSGEKQRVMNLILEARSTQIEDLGTRTNKTGEITEASSEIRTGAHETYILEYRGGNKPSLWAQGRAGTDRTSYNMGAGVDKSRLYDLYIRLTKR